MFKSPSYNAVPKKGPISFIKTSSSPRHVNSAKAILVGEQDFVADQFSRPAAQSVLSIEVIYDKFSQARSCTFPFNQKTTIQQLLDFLHKELQEEHLYFRSRNLNLDYLLTLKNRTVKELSTKRLELVACKIKIFPKQRILSNFDIIKCVGTGGFSKVYLCRAYGQLMALKAIVKGFIVENEKQNIVDSQRTILEKCSGHPFITKLHLSFETKSYLIFCMEYCNGGELFNLLRKVRRMKEEEAKFYFLETLAAISHLHSQQILYRDLKPENIIIDSEGHIRLADYGLSKIMKDGMTHSFCGSAQYMAPEMLLKKGHSFEIDYYCLGALLYELLFGLPPYYSRNQNQLFNNILTKDLQFPDNIEVSKDLKNFLRRMLQKDTDMRFKTISDILKHPWMKDVNMNDVLSKKLIPPFKTDMFQNNFDSTDFERDEQKEILKLEREKDRCNLDSNQTIFKEFFYISSDLEILEKDIQRQNETNLDFSKKTSQIGAVTNAERSLIRNHTMKSADSSQLYMERQQQQHSPRIIQTNNQQTGRSGEKLKMFITQASKMSPSAYGSHNITPQPSYFGGHPKTSEILNGSKDSSGIVNSSVSKLVEVRSVPYLNRNQPNNPSPSSHDNRMGSPININNYINIYTNKSPPKGPQISFTRPTVNLPSQQRKPQNIVNYSYEKNLTNNSYKNNFNSYQTANGSLDRVKFSSLDKPTTLHTSNSGSFLRNSPYYQNPNTANRGYLSNFRDRVNPSHKIKKSYKTTEKMSFNFFTPNTPYGRT